MATKKRPVLIRFQPFIYEKLQFLADNDKRTVTNLVEYWVEQQISNYESKHGQISPLVQNTNNGNGKFIANTAINMQGA